MSSPLRVQSSWPAAFSASAISLPTFCGNLPFEKANVQERTGKPVPEAKGKMRNRAMCIQSLRINWDSSALLGL